MRGRPADAGQWRQRAFKRHFAVAVVVYALLFWLGVLAPFDFYLPESIEAAFARSEDSDFGLRDGLSAIGHAAFFIPLGILLESALAARAWRRVIVAGTGGLALAVVSEGIQMLTSRHATLGDFLMDLAGLLLGCVLAFSYRRSASMRRGVRALFSPLALSSVLVAAALAFVVLRVPRPTEYAGWDASFPFLVGNEVTGDRPWRGVLHEVVLLAGALEEEEIKRLYSASPGDDLLAGRGAPLARYVAADGMETGGSFRLPDTSGREPAIDLYAGVPFDGESGSGLEPLPGGLRLDHPPPLRSRVPTGRITEAIRAAGAMTLIVSFRAWDAGALGPARLVSLSGGVAQRNFMLGQEGSSLHFRVRNTATDENGMRPQLVAPGSVHPQRRQLAVAVNTSTESRLYVDGHLEARVTFSLLTALEVAVFRKPLDAFAWQVVFVMAWLVGLLLYGAILLRFFGGSPWLEIAALADATLTTAILYAVF